MEPTTYEIDGYTYTDEPSWVYALCDPRTGEAKYVGVSINPFQRAKQHLSVDGCENRRNPNAKRRWIKELKALGMRPELTILEEVAGSCPTIGKQHPAQIEAEQRWIVKLARAGHGLTNGNLPPELEDSEETAFQKALERGRELFGHLQN